MKILFLDQSGSLGGAELGLLDLAEMYRDRCLVGLFADGAFRQRLEQKQIPVQVLTANPIKFRREDGLLQGFGQLGQVLPLIAKTAQLSSQFDLIYTNTQKALLVGAFASILSRKPLVFRLEDIISSEHFSRANQQLIVFLANRFASRVIANSKSTAHAFVHAGGRDDRLAVVYNGIDPSVYRQKADVRSEQRQSLSIENQFVIGHFSRLSPWKGQHVLVDAMQHCPEHAIALFVGDALFGEQAYVEQLHKQVKRLGLENRVKFLGFQSDVAKLMSVCDLIVHSSTSPEPFGRVIVEAMMCGKPSVASAAGGATEIINHGETGWLTPPNDSQKLAEVINECIHNPRQSAAIAEQGQQDAIDRFNLERINQEFDAILSKI